MLIGFFCKNESPSKKAANPYKRPSAGGRIGVGTYTRAIKRFFLSSLIFIKKQKNKIINKLSWRGEEGKEALLLRKGGMGPYN